MRVQGRHPIHSGVCVGLGLVRGDKKRHCVREDAPKAFHNSQAEGKTNKEQQSREGYYRAHTGLYSAQQKSIRDSTWTEI